MELRSRSRSNTPYSGNGNEENPPNQNEGNNTNAPGAPAGQAPSSRVLRSSKLRTVVEVHEGASHRSSKHFHSSSHSSSHHSHSHQHYVTSDYSSEDGELMHDADVYSNNRSNHAFEHSRQGVRMDELSQNGDNLLAYKMFREAKEYWNRYPKTDYTYSPNSRDRIEIAPGVVNMPNMSRKSIHTPAGDDDAEVDANTTGTQCTTGSYHALEQVFNVTHLRPRSLFGAPTLHNNNVYQVINNGSQTDLASMYAQNAQQERSIWYKIYCFVAATVWILTKPLWFINAGLFFIISLLYRSAGHLLIVDAWLLRGFMPPEHLDGLRRQRLRFLGKTLLTGLALLLIVGGLWLLSQLGHILKDMIPAIIPIMMSSNKATTFTQQQQSPPFPHSKTSSSETIIKIQLDSPVRTGLSTVQLRQVAQAVRDNLNLNMDVETIMQVLKSDGNVQVLEDSTPAPADIAAALTNEQISTITNNLNLQNVVNKQESIDQVIEKVLESPSIQKLFENYNVHQMHEQDKLIEQLHSEIVKLRIDLNAAVFSNSAKYAQLAHSIKRCCRLSALQMEHHLNTLIAALLNSDEHKNNMSKWLGAFFVAQTELEGKLHNLTEKMNKRFDDLIALSASKIMADVSTQLAGHVSASRIGSPAIPPNELQIRAIVKGALATYDADKTGLVDYALESAGGEILSTRCTEHYSARTSVVSIFGVPLWYPSASPRTVITPGVVPGECWAFQSFPAFVIIKLSHNVTIDAFSYEHVSRQLTPSGRIDSAPKDFQVFGLDHEHDRDAALLGEYRYDAEGDALQFFLVNEADVLRRSFHIVELKVNSNHGNPNYSCLYRFRVHGKLAT